MTVRAHKPEFNFREKLKELERPIGVKGNELMRAETAQDARDLVSAGRKNLIINGAMQVAQRGTSFSSAAAGITLDRWGFGDTTNAVFDVVRSSTAPAGFSNSLRIDCTTSSTPASVQESYIEHKIEAQNLQHLQYGTSGAQSVTLSFWVRSNKTGHYGMWVYQEDAASQYATTYTISFANTWEHKTITIPGNTSTAINNDNGMGLNFRFYLQAGPTYAGTPAETWTTSLNSNRTTSINLGDSTSNEWYLTGVQLEVGKNATEFEHRSYGEELALCQRYYYRINAFETYSRFALGIVRNNVNAQYVVNHPVEMRIPPTVGDSGAGTIQVSDTVTGTPTNGSLSLVNTTNGTHQSGIQAPVASGLTQYRPAILEASNNTNAYIEFSADI